VSAADRKRWQLIAVVAVAAILNVIATELHSRILGWLGFAVLFFGILLFVRWRRAAIAERRGRVFDREAKTDETRTGPDK
jgi:energy-coupling factor transporter transmembrane protein EcfT